MSDNKPILCVIINNNLVLAVGVVDSVVKLFYDRPQMA